MGRGTFMALCGLGQDAPVVPAPPHRPSPTGHRGREAQTRGLGPAPPSGPSGIAATSPSGPRRVEPAGVAGSPRLIGAARSFASLPSGPGPAPTDVPAGPLWPASSTRGRGPVGASSRQGEPGAWLSEDWR